MIIEKAGQQYFTKCGAGIFFSGDSVLGKWGIHDIIKIEAPVKLGNTQIDASEIGAFTFINSDYSDNKSKTIIDAKSIGRFCAFANEVTIGLPEHSIEFLSVNSFFRYNKEWQDSYWSSNQDRNWRDEMSKKYQETIADKRELASIGNDVWVGYRSIVLNGCKIGNGAIIAAGAVVTKDVEPYTIVGGVPAKPIRKRFSEKTIEKLMQIQWWKYGPDILIGLDLSNVDHIIDNLEKRVADGFPEYNAEVIEFSLKKNTVLI
jgi:acetyltransferase-like isoleucine patch superfamily enzyme